MEIVKNRHKKTAHDGLQSEIEPPSKTKKKKLKRFVVPCHDSTNQSQFETFFFEKVW
jgi:hypothetical protein